jgi:hypothetical protein
MIYNYRSLNDIAKKNKGKIATFDGQIINNKKKPTEDHRFFLLFEDGDRIRFYHYQDVYTLVNTSVVGEFHGLVEKIQLLEIYHQKEAYIETKLLINDIICVSWSVYCEINDYEPIDWEITKNETKSN